MLTEHSYTVGRRVFLRRREVGVTEDTKLMVVALEVSAPQVRVRVVGLGEEEEGDFGGRFYLDFKADFPESHVGDLPCDMVPHVFYSLAEHMQANLHIAVTGDNTHHMVEACFKGFGRALRQAIQIEGIEMPSTKGIL